MKYRGSCQSSLQERRYVWTVRIEDRRNGYANKEGEIEDDKCSNSPAHDWVECLRKFEKADKE